MILINLLIDFNIILSSNLSILLAMHLHFLKIIATNDHFDQSIYREFTFFRYSGWKRYNVDELDQLTDRFWYLREQRNQKQKNQPKYFKIFENVDQIKPLC